MGMEGVAAATIVAKNYLSFARVLANSFRAHHPDIPFFVLLTDEVDGYFDPAAEPFQLLALSDLAIPDLPRFRFHYTQQELTYAATPYLLSHLLQRGFTRAAFFKQESLVVGDLTPILAAMESSAIVLTPHLLEPLPDGHASALMIERELNILQSGVYNVGFLGVSESPEAREFLVWWSDRVYAYCRHDVPQGMHFEQRWLDLVPAFFTDVHVLRDPGFNIGHWNLPERELDFHGETLKVDGHLCRFIRFSGFDPDYPYNATRYSARLNMDNVSAATARVFRRYLSLLEAAGYHETKRWPYAYGCFDNGVAISERARHIYRELEEEAGEFGDPFAATPVGSYFRWLNRHAYDHPGVRGKVARMWRTARGGGGWREVTWTLLSIGRQRLSAAAHSIYQANGRGQLPRARRFKRLTPEAALARRDYDLPFGVNLAGYLASEKGVGEAARSFARSLLAASVPHVLNNFEDAHSSNLDSTLHTFSRQNPYQINLLCVDPASISNFIAEYGAAHFAGRYNVAHWPWELSDFPRGWTSYFQHLNEVWVPSSFACESLAKGSPVPVRTVPYTVTGDILPDSDKTDFGLPSDKMIFLFIFDFASYFIRKNPLGLVRAFKLAFAPGDDALLVLKCSRSAFAPAERKALQEACGGAATTTTAGQQVRIMDGVLPRAQINSLMRQAHCYVSLHRAEGFGLTLAEAMSLGKPVIATGYSGNMDFMTSQNSFPVDYRLAPIEHTHGPYQRGSLWAEPDVEHAAGMMRRVYEQWERAETVGRQARQDVLARLHPRVVGEQIKQLLSGVAV